MSANPSNYIAIALNSCLLKKWTSILTSIRTQTPEAESIFRDTADGFHSHGNIYDSLSAHTMMYEDVNISRKDIYTAYSDFKAAFGGMDHGFFFELMKDYGFQNFYITA